MAKEICDDCEKVYEGGPYSNYCPDCLRARLSKTAKRRNLNRLGNEAYSEQRAIARKEAHP